MTLSLQKNIYIFTLSSCLLFVILVLSILWSIQAINVALEREKYAHKVEGHAHILKQIINTENIYASNYNIDDWLALDKKFVELLEYPPTLTSKQQTIQNSIESQNKSILRLFNLINKNKLQNADEAIKKHLKIRLITQLEAIRTDSIQLSDIVNKDIVEVIKRQVIFIISVFSVIIFTLILGAYRLIKVFRTSLTEVKNAFEKNHSGSFQKIELSNQSEEFTSIANAFNAMNKKLSETTVSLASMKKIVEERTHVLEQLTRTDYLTNVANRRALFERGNIEFSRAQRNRSQLSVILFDCDLFKNINDQFGHTFGDEILKHICKIGTKETRSIDLFARYGGEEFIIILPDTAPNSAVETAKRIQHSLANNGISFEGKQVVNVTISIGICSLDSKHDNFEQIVKDADKAMYKAKTNGRNRIEIISDETSH